MGPSRRLRRAIFASHHVYVHATCNCATNRHVNSTLNRQPREICFLDSPREQHRAGPTSVTIPTASFCMRPRQLPGCRTAAEAKSQASQI